MVASRVTSPWCSSFARALLLGFLLASISGCTSLRDSLSEWWSPTRDGGILDSSADKSYESADSRFEPGGDKAPPASEPAAENPPLEKQPGVAAVIPIQQASHAAAAPTESPLRKALGKDAWALNVVLPGASNLEPTARWRNPTLEATLRTAPDKRPDVTSLIDDQDPILAFNAAAVAARWHQGQPAARLAATIHNTELRMPVRRAAVEAIGLLDTSVAASTLHELLGEFGQFAGSMAHAYVAELHGDLLTELAHHEKVTRQPTWLAPLKSPDLQVRIVALNCWSTATDQALPPAALELCSDNEVRVRCAALHMLGVRRDPKSIDHLRRALDDYDLNVRLATVAALGELGTPDARASLEKLRAHSSELIRATAVESLAACHAEAAVAAAVDDKSWRVRLAVAKAIKSDPDAAQRNPREASRLIKKLVEDKNTQVQLAAIEAVVDWPLEQAAPPLLTVMRDAGYQVRKSAARQLIERWAPAADFPIDGSAENRLAALERLQKHWNADFGVMAGSVLPDKIEAPRVVLARLETQFRRQMLALKDDVTPAAEVATVTTTPIDAETIRGLLSKLGDPQSSKLEKHAAIDSLRGAGTAILPMLEQMAVEDGQLLPEDLYTEVLPDLHPAFGALDSLLASEATLRWAGADKLAALAVAKPLAPLALDRLATVMAAQKEPLVWQAIMNAIMRDAREPAIRLAYMAAGNESAEVRRRACEYLLLHPNAKHAATLVPLVDDPQSTVAIAAVRALGAGGGLEDPAPLVALLPRPEKTLRLEAAVALARQGVTEGIASLERLAADPDADVRRSTAIALGQLADPAFVPTLMVMLEDRHDIQRTALDSLTAAAGKDVSAKRPDDESTPTVAERIRRWQRWYAETR